MRPATEDISGLRFAHGVDAQAGVVAWLPDTKPLKFCLVTSRRTGRWVFPKGGVESGMTPIEAAAQEALEEAGVVGEVGAQPIGRYRVPKIRPPLIWTIDVSLYPMRIEEVLDIWIEADQRRRRFVTLREAQALLTEPEMVKVAESLVGAVTTA